MIGPEKRYAIDHARGRVGVFCPLQQLVIPKILNTPELRRFEARARNDVGKDRERGGQIVLEDGERHEARVGVRVCVQSRTEIVERASQVDSAARPRPFVEHVCRGVGESRLAFGIAGSPRRYGQIAGHQRHLVSFEKPHRHPAAGAKHFGRWWNERRSRDRLGARSKRIRRRRRGGMRCACAG